MCEVSSWSLMFATALLVLQATFQSPRLVESSGVAVSRAYPGVLWTHNDSGDGPYLYATDLRGPTAARCSSLEPRQSIGKTCRSAPARSPFPSNPGRPDRTPQPASLSPLRRTTWS